MKYSRALAASAVVATASAQANYTLQCQTGLHVIVARASNEKPGYGILGPVKDQILSRVPNSDSVWVDYPATLANYTTSQPAGVVAMTKLITDYVDACPCNKIALLGYSQGAHVIGDTVIGRDYPNFPQFGDSTTGVGSKYLDSISSYIMMGDPANVAGVPILVGNSTRNGTFPRANTAAWTDDKILGKIQSYCDAEDTFCDSGTLGQQSIRIHIGYIPEYGSKAADYVVGKAMNGTTASCSNSTSSGSSGGSSSNGTMSATTPAYNSPSATGSSAPAAQTTNSAVKAGLSSALILAAVAAVL